MSVVFDEEIRVDKLRKTINSESDEKSSLKSFQKANGRKAYPLGRIIPYEDYMLLAFSHFDEYNNAYIDITEYEACLLRMWKEIRRLYADRPITIPLIGSGITDIEGIGVKDDTELLKCILCSLRNSKFVSQRDITIILTPGKMSNINMSEIRSLYGRRE